MTDSIEELRKAHNHLVRLKDKIDVILDMDKSLFDKIFANSDMAYSDIGYMADILKSIYNNSEV